ncbi:hypothetical protein [Nocardioides pantholopis]|uniref:hypothetical protein n=1 Tax=Nocardioides pantholopis TaxID=2483798 RepID=UPI000FDB4E32|nr:hypothetical protein [Nocardioides pantholopis]
MLRILLALVAAAVMTMLMVLLVAGHGPWAGEVVWRLSPGRGVNAGDLPVFASWVVGMLACAGLARG